MHTRALASQLDMRGHQLTLLEFGAPLYSNDRDSMGFPGRVERAENQFTSPLRIEQIGFRTWLKVFATLDADVALIIKGNFQFGSLALEAACRYRYRRVGVLEHMHEPIGPRPPFSIGRLGIPRFGAWWHVARFKGALRSLFPTTVFCVSQTQAQTLLEDYLYPRAKVRVNHAGVDVDRFMPNEERRQTARMTWSIPHDALVFGSVGRLSPMKNHSMMLQAFAKLVHSDTGRDCRLVLVGEGPTRQTLIEEAKSLDISSRVSFLGFSSDPAALYPAFDVLCLSTTGESFGLVLIEAMACGVPLIATAVGGVPEILTDARTGWLIPQGDQFAFASAMREASRMEPESLRAMGIAARRVAETRFNAAVCWERWADDIERAAARKMN